MVRTNQDEVIGKIDHRGITATLQLKILDGRITYSCERTDPPRHAGGHGPMPRNRSTPKASRPCTGRKVQGWINNIRRDIEEMLVLSGLESSNDAVDRVPAAEQLATLEALRSQGLVSQQEYGAKRAEILSELWPHARTTRAG